MGFERPTVNGARPQAILNPHGNKGPDLIETIRLEKLANDKRLFVPQHHSFSRPDSRSRMNPAETMPTQSRPWAEPQWTRPKSAGALRVHSAERLNELLLSSDSEQFEQSSRLPSPAPKSSCNAGSSSASVTTGRASPPATGTPSMSKRRPQSAHLVAEDRARERQRAQHQAMQEKVMRKLKEAQSAAAVRSEEEFSRAWEQFQAEQAGPVAEITEMLRLKDAERVRRANETCKYWNEEIYDKISAQVALELRKREYKGTYNTRWRRAQDEYLSAVERKEAGVFRDIIIQDEYDPQQTANGNIRYSSKGLDTKDPMKAELTKHRLEARMVPGSAAAISASASSRAGRDSLPVTQWSKLDATPYGHFNKLMARDHSKKPRPYSTTGMRVLGDHYTRH